MEDKTIFHNACQDCFKNMIQVILLPSGQEDPGLGPFCVELSCSPCFVGSLWVSYVTLHRVSGDGLRMEG